MIGHKPGRKAPASRTVRKYISVVEDIQLVVFCYGSLSGLIEDLCLPDCLVYLLN